MAIEHRSKKVPWVELRKTDSAANVPPGRQMRSNFDAVNVFREALGPDTALREHFVVMALNTKHRLVGLHVVAIGTADGCTASPREVFLAALAMDAKAILVAHNHPSGDPTPSSDDRDVTQRLRDAGELLGIELLDHLILGKDDYYAFSEERKLAYPNAT